MDEFNENMRQILQRADNGFYWVKVRARIRCEGIVRRMKDEPTIPKPELCPMCKRPL